MRIMHVMGGGDVGGAKTQIMNTVTGLNRNNDVMLISFRAGPCAEEAPEEVVGHTGFTGTCAWADPKNHLVFVFLSNRIYPRPFDHKQLMRLNIRPRMQQVMYQALMK